MEKNNSSKIIAIAALMLAVVAVTIGFASYTATLNITNAKANVGSDTFAPNVNFNGTVQCVKTGTETVVQNPGSASGKTWNNVAVSLGAPGDSVTCTATVSNTSSFTAYLDEISSATTLSCTTTGVETNAATTGVEDACAGIKVEVSSEATNKHTITKTANTATTNISSDSIAAGSTKDITMVISYESGSTQANGNFIVNIPQINLVYNTED